MPDLEKFYPIMDMILAKAQHDPELYDSLKWVAEQAEDADMPFELMMLKVINDHLVSKNAKKFMSTVTRKEAI